MESVQQGCTGGAGGRGGGRENIKKVRYKDVIRQQMLEDGDALGYARPTLDGNTDDEGGPPGDRRGYAYDDEQKQLRAEFLMSAGGVDGDFAGGLLKESADTAGNADPNVDNDNDDGAMSECGRRLSVLAHPLMRQTSFWKITS